MKKDNLRSLHVTSAEKLEFHFITDFNKLRITQLYHSTVQIQRMKNEMRVDGKRVPCLDREGDEGENLLEPFELVLKRGCVPESHQSWRRHGSECHELVEVNGTSDVRMSYK